MSSILIRRGEDTQRYTQRGGRVMTEVETGLKQLPAKGHRGLLEATES